MRDARGTRYAPAEVLEAAPQSETPSAELAACTGAAPAIGRRRLRRKSVTREDMLRDLARIADYFRRFEPQSPLSLTLDEAIRRARLSWNELLEEVVASQDARNAMLVQLGIRPKKAEPDAKS